MERPRIPLAGHGGPAPGELGDVGVSAVGGVALGDPAGGSRITPSVWMAAHRSDPLVRPPGPSRSR